VLKYWKELRTFWHVLDNTGYFHILQYNKIFDHPLIIGGWNTLTNFAHLTNNVDVLFAYYGYQCFGIYIFQSY
jgi:hypothetical protein